MFDYDKAASNAVKILDEYDFKDDILRCKNMGQCSPYDIIEYIEFNNHYEVTDALVELTTDEFMEYLTDRYGVRWREVVSYYMI